MPAPQDLRIVGLRQVKGCARVATRNSSLQEEPRAADVAETD
jgi:hypothetical protein